jgi:surface antigen
MWKIPTFVRAQLAIVGVPVLVITSGVGWQNHDKAVQTAARAAEARQAQKLAAGTAVSRSQLQALEQAVWDREQEQKALTATQVDRDQLQAKANDLQAQVDKLQNQLGALNSGIGSGGTAMASGRTSSASGANHFPFGYCTFYVASRRWVPWNGNAITWLWGARAFGYPTGSTPRVGAIMVTAESVWGHVAYVETVGSNGSFTVSEMNFVSWGMVDWRTILPGKVPVLGFVY